MRLQNWEKFVYNFNYTCITQPGFPPDAGSTGRKHRPGPVNRYLQHHLNAA